MIASLTELKALLQMTSTTQDDLLNRIMPIVEDDIRQYCNNGFRNPRVYVSSAEISFTHNSTSGDTINLDIGANENGFVIAQFKAGQTVQVTGSYNNNNFFEIESVTSTALTLYSSTSLPYYPTLANEGELLNVVIHKVEYPAAVKNIAAQMCRYKLTNHDYSVESESVSRYSVTYAKDHDSGYPKGLMGGLNRWRNPVLV